MFILFLNDIFKVCILPTILCFADDTLLLYEIDKNQNGLSVGIKTSLNSFFNWFNSNLLLLNENKSNCMIYSTYSKNRQINVQVNLGSKAIKEVNSFKYLGLLFDCNLKWNSQITFVIMFFVNIVENIINFILKQKLIFLLTNKNRFNIGFNTNLTNNNVTSLRSSVKIHTPYYSKTVGQFKLDFRAAIIFNIIPIGTLELLFLNNTINKKATKEYVLKIINFK